MIALGAGIALLLLVVGFLALEFNIFRQFTSVDPTTSINLPNTPDHFQVRGGRHMDFDTTPYEIPAYQNVRFPSRQAGVQLAGWYVPGDPSAPAIVVTHGFRQCKCDSNVLIPAGMLHRHGFNVLLIDLRNHGHSDVTNQRASYGSSEYPDVLGGWDWLMAQKGFPSTLIGLFGVSMGGASTLIAFAQEPRAAAAFVDSPPFDVTELLADELGRRGLPRFLAPGAIRMGWLVGDNLLAHGPQEGIRQANGRPLYLVQGTLDARVDVRHHYQFKELAGKTGAHVTSWVVEGAEHVESALTAPAEYEQRLTDFFKRVLATTG